MSDLDLCTFPLLPISSSPREPPSIVCVFNLFPHFSILSHIYDFTYMYIYIYLHIYTYIFSLAYFELYKRLYMKTYMLIFELLEMVQTAWSPLHSTFFHYMIIFLRFFEVAVFICFHWCVIFYDVSISTVYLYISLLMNIWVVSISFAITINAAVNIFVHLSW